MSESVLVVDDLRIFDDYPDAVYARTLKEGIGQLRRPFATWDIVFLDHDLGQTFDVHGNPADSDIRPLVNWVAAENAFNPDELHISVKQFYVCTNNPPGRDWIIGMLQPYYPIEYFQPKFHIIDGV